jgi:predicted negative regulator of RcsB-dependent stress response
LKNSLIALNEQKKHNLFLIVCKVLGYCFVFQHKVIQVEKAEKSTCKSCDISKILTASKTKIIVDNTTKRLSNFAANKKTELK